MDIKYFLATFVSILGEVIVYAVLARVFLSLYFAATLKHPGPITRFIFEATEPVFAVIRKIPHSIGILDLSPIIALIGVRVLVYLVLQLLAQF